MMAIKKHTIKSKVIAKSPIIPSIVCFTIVKQI